jgi:hypothetical protein
MTQKYLLPCRCGKSVVVEPRQAGRTIACSCGASLLIPTMREIAALEPAPEEDFNLNSTASSEDASGQKSLAETAWGIQQRLFLIGAVLAGIGLIAFFIVTLFFRPIAPADVIDAAQLAQSAQNFPPAKTWVIWLQYKQGLDTRTNQRFADAMLNYHVWQTIFGLAFLAGAALAITGVVLKQKQRRLEMMNAALQ